MDSKEFVKHLNEIQNLMEKENYTEAIKLIEKLKEVDKKADLDYNLTHRLYQLDSNSHSLYNQQLIIQNVSDLSKRYKSITFQELNHVLRSENKLNLSDDILRREIELLILRDKIAWKIERDMIILD